MSQLTVTDTVEKTLEAYFRANFSFSETVGTTWPVEYPNMDIDKKSLIAWVRFNIIWAASVRNVITGERDSGQKQIGNVNIQIFTRKGSGPGANRRCCDAVAYLFNEVDIGVTSQDKIRFFIPWPSVQGIGSEQWYQRNVIAPFEHESL